MIVGGLHWSDKRLAIAKLQACRPELKKTKKSIILRGTEWRDVQAHKSENTFCFREDRLSTWDRFWVQVLKHKKLSNRILAASERSSSRRVTVNAWFFDMRGEFKFIWMPIFVNSRRCFEVRSLEWIEATTDSRVHVHMQAARIAKLRTASQLDAVIVTWESDGPVSGRHNIDSFRTKWEDWLDMAKVQKRELVIQ